MAGIEERVKGFLDSWSIVKKQLEELTEGVKDDEGLFHSDGVGRSLPGESKDDLPASMGQGDPGL